MRRLFLALFVLALLASAQTPAPNVTYTTVIGRKHTNEVNQALKTLHDNKADKTDLDNVVRKNPDGSVAICTTLPCPAGTGVTISPTTGILSAGQSGYGAPTGTLTNQFYANLSDGSLWMNVGGVWTAVSQPMLPPLGLLAYYDFRPGSDAAVLYDRSGNGRNGTVASGSNAPVWLKRGLAFFQGGPTYATFPSTALVSGDAAMTVIVAGRRPQILNGNAVLWGYAASPTTRAAPGWAISALDPQDSVILHGGGDNVAVNYDNTNLTTHVYAYRYNPTGTAVTANVDQIIHTTTGTLGGVLAANAASGGKFGAYGNTNTFPLTGSVYAFAVWNRLLSDAEVAQVAAFFSQADAANNLIVFDGNSLTAGTPVYDVGTYPYQAMTAIKGAWDWYNFGVSGQTTTQMAADFDTQVKPLFNSSRTKQILVAWEIGNELGAKTAQQAYDAFAAYCTHARSVLPSTAKIIVINVTPRVTAGFNEKRNAANTLLAAGWSTFADALVDVAADADIGCDACHSNVTYYQADGIHLTAAGYLKVANLVKTAILAQ